MQRYAKISEDGLYRYGLVRRWDEAGPFATFVMLNPSTADAELDDPTIRRCMGFARSWGMGGVHVLNLYAYRATKPADLWRAEDPVGPETDQHLLRHMAAHAGTAWPLVAAWGANARADRVASIGALWPFAPWTCLGTTKDGHPRHPLYVKGDTQLEPYGIPDGQ